MLTHNLCSNDSFSLSDNTFTNNNSLVMAGIIKCPKCGKNMLISKKVIETGKHKGEQLVSCFNCGYKTYLKY